MLPWIDVHTHNETSEHVIAVRNLMVGKGKKVESGFFSVGIHPWYINDVEDQKSSFIESMHDVKCVAIGECGLDKAIDFPLLEQMEIFRWQLKVAQEQKKPVIIHCVRAYQEVIKVCADMKTTTPLIFHGFNKHFTLAEELIDKGFYLSFGCQYLQSEIGRKTLLTIDPDRFFLETDNQNEFSIIDTYQVAASILSCSVDELKQRIISNFNKIVGDNGKRLVRTN